MNEDIARRSVVSVQWNFVSNIVDNVFSFALTIALARLLPVETFGIYAGAASILAIVSSLANFGLGAAFIHRCKETEDLERTAAIHFTLQLILNFIWTAAVLTAGLLALDRTEPGLLLAYVVLTFTYMVQNFTATPRIILTRQIRFKRMAIYQILDTTITFSIAIALAFLKQPIWALLATNIVDACVQVFVFYIYKPVWRPRLMWSTSTVRYFLGFGVHQVVAQWLVDTLDKGDDFWTKTFLGAGPLGFYSRAYALAKIPSNIVASPVSQVAAGTYAELKGDKEGLSEAYFETNALLIRSGYVLAGILALVAPEFIRIVLGEKWMPLLTTFRLMLPFTMFDPMKRMMASLFVAVGKPSITVRVRAVQLVIMVFFLFVLGLPLGIEGVALAVDIMMVAGIAMSLFNARPYVNLSLLKLFLIPSIGLGLGLVTGYLAAQIPGIRGNDWFTGITKSVVFLTVYGLTLWIRERDQIFRYVQLIKKNVIRKGKKRQYAEIQP